MPSEKFSYVPTLDSSHLSAYNNLHYTKSCADDTINITSRGIAFDHPSHEHVNPPSVYKNHPHEHKTYHWLNTFKPHNKPLQ